MSSTNTEYVDVTTYSGEQLAELLHIADKKPVLLYMPDIDYSGMQMVEDFASKNGFQVLNIPITLPLMDIAKQAKYAGVCTNPLFLLRITRGLRSMITCVLNASEVGKND